MVNDVHGSPVRASAVGGRARVLFEGHEIADSDRALFLTEPDGAITVYFPAGDVTMAFLRRNDHVTSSPWMGSATWFTINRDGRIVEDAAWTCERPFKGAVTVAGFIAFLPEHVELQLDAPAPVPRVPAHDPPYV